MASKNLNIYEINTATWLVGLSQKYAKDINLANIPSSEWDDIASLGFNAVWLMGVWQRSPAAIDVNSNDPNFAPEMKSVLTDFNFKNDVIGSAYSIRSYSVNDSYGGNNALVIAKNNLNRRNLKLILDYVPNHVALDNDWAYQHPEYFITGTSEDLSNLPGEYVQINTNIYALGRDPNFKPWSDVIQLNAFSPELRAKSIETLANISSMCDGVRCDMAMLMTNDIFKYTWQSKCGDIPETDYWQDLISTIKQKNTDFIFMAEAYWDTQELLINLGFDYCYDKEFYDFIKKNDYENLKNNLLKPLSYQKKLLRFLENHDEPRAAHTFTLKHHFASAIVLATIPGAHLYYNGQLDGSSIRTPVQLGRDPFYTPSIKIQKFYNNYLSLIRSMNFNQDTWALCHTTVRRRLVKVTSKYVFSWGWNNGNDYYITVINLSNKKRAVNINTPWPDINLNKTSNVVLFIVNNNHQAKIKYQLKLIKIKLLAYESLVIKINR